MTTVPKFYLLMDSNVWIMERMLLSNVGVATLHALTKQGAQIAVPEIVRREVDEKLLELGGTSLDKVETAFRLLRQLSGREAGVLMCSESHLSNGIENRWAQLAGLLHYIPFTFEQSQRALTRIIKRMPPTGQNNEQFRDCCIWECVLELLNQMPVQLISADQCFYQNGNRQAGISDFLRDEALRRSSELFLHSSLISFLQSTSSMDAAQVEEKLRLLIIDAVTPQAKEIAEDIKRGGAFYLGTLLNAKITKHATPRASILTTYFSLLYELRRVETRVDGETQERLYFELDGSCSYDPVVQVVSDIEVSNWSKSADSPSGSWRVFLPERGSQTLAD